MAGIAKVGEIRDRKGGRFKKLAAGKWAKLSTAKPIPGSPPKEGPPKAPRAGGPPKKAKRWAGGKEVAPEGKKSLKEWAKKRSWRESPKFTTYDPHEFARLSDKDDAWRNNTRKNPKLTDEEKAKLKTLIDHRQKMAQEAESVMKAPPKPEDVSRARQYAKEVTPDQVSDRLRELTERFVTKVDANDDYEYGHRMMVPHRDKLEPEDRAIVDAVTLFSDGNVATVRDPKNYDPAKAGGEGGSTVVQGPKYLTGIHHAIKAPSKEDYQAAHEIMKKIATSPVDPAEVREVHRGIALPHEAIGALRVGATFDGREIASWSYDPKMADSFGQAEARRTGGQAVIFRMKQPKRGSDITALSHYGEEEEFVTGGKLRITGGDFGPKGEMIFDVEQE